MHIRYKLKNSTETVDLPKFVNRRGVTLTFSTILIPVKFTRAIPKKDFEFFLLDGVLIAGKLEDKKEIKKIIKKEIKEEE